MAPSFPKITGTETNAELNRLAKQLREWRSSWLKRIYGAGLPTAGLSLVFLNGLNGFLAASMAVVLQLAFHTAIDARVLAVTGRKGMALFYRFLSGCSAVSAMVIAFVWVWMVR